MVNIFLINKNIVDRLKTAGISVKCLIINASGIRLINNATKVIQVTMHNEIDGARRGMNSRNYNQSRILSNKFCKFFSNLYCI